MTFHFSQPEHHGERAIWISLLERIARPVLETAASGNLRLKMPVEAADGLENNQRRFSHLEAVGRSLAGMAPWLEVELPTGPERELQAEFRDLARKTLGNILRRPSQGGLNFTEGNQPLVDAAFLAQALLRAPCQLWDRLDEDVRQNAIERLRETRSCHVSNNNWLLFAGMIEAALMRFGGVPDALRIDYAVRQHDQWYVGDGWVMDGPRFHLDYYNSLVIHPMILDVLTAVGATTGRWDGFLEPARARAIRHAGQLERLIAPDGSFPVLGRSIAYRSGAFHLLAQIALRGELPEDLSPGRVRSALTAMMRRCFEAPGTFDENGWLKIGLCGHQPSLGESYISTGSLYLCLTSFLPLGLPPSDPFWSAPAEPWTSVLAWSGHDLARDKALAD